MLEDIRVITKKVFDEFVNKELDRLRNYLIKHYTIEDLIYLF